MRTTALTVKLFPCALQHEAATLQGHGLANTTMNSHDEAAITQPVPVVPVKLSKWHRMTPEQKARVRERRKRWLAERPGYEAATQRRHRAKNPDVASERYRAYRLKHPDRVRASKRKWAQNNPEKVAAQKQRHRTKHADSIRAKNDRYQRSNRDKVRQWAAESKARNPDHYSAQARVHKQNRRHRTVGRLSSNIAVVRLVEQKFKCTYCQAILHETGYHLDHMTPLARGGLNVDENMHAICPTCNLRKFTKTHDEFLALLAHENARPA